jgi:hypothetical protein
MLSSITGLVGLLMGYIAKSKCSRFSCCYGLFYFDRDINSEIETEILQSNRSSSVWENFENNKNR